ncbi:MAG: SelL-related redox protein [bacterium]|nr:AhpC/TSA family protein [Planctomycetaceae bacterium]
MSAGAAVDARTALRGAMTSGGQSVAELSMRSPVLMVFLRHFGCTFCREALADVRAQLARVRARGVAVVLVHMADAAYGERFLGSYGLGTGEGVSHVSDPDKRLYRAMGLKRGTLGQLFGWKSWVRGFKAGLIDGHLVGKLVGDGFQMPGVFLVDRGEVVRTYRHTSAADRPDYDELAVCPIR